MHPLKLIIAGVLLSVLVVHADSGVTPDEFERLHKEIRPRAGESPWAEIDWMYDLQAARKKAAAEGKPLCIWRMAGDPTGVC